MAVKRIGPSAMELLITKNECAFQPVLDDFPNAESITVVTYNISPSEAGLLRNINSASSAARIITNIPGRFAKYYGEDKAKAAKRTIERYFSLLDPLSFTPTTKVSFNFSNHSKIVMTENIAYIGSANFSNESQSNWECGALTTDPSVIRSLSEAVDAIERESIRFYGPKMLELIEPMLVVRLSLENLRERLNEDFTTEVLEAIGEAVEELRAAVSATDKDWYELAEPSGPVASVIDMGLLDRVEQLSASEALVEYGDFDPDEIDAGELPSDAYDEKLDMYLESAADRNLEHQEHLRHDAEECLVELASGLDLLSAQIQQVFVKISDTLAIIDNTKK